MENRKIRLNQSVGSLCVVLCLLVYAYYAREWERRLSAPLGKTVLSLSRHLIHAGLIFCWILSVNARIIQVLCLCRCGFLMIEHRFFVSVFIIHIIKNRVSFRFSVSSIIR